MKTEFKISVQVFENAVWQDMFAIEMSTPTIPRIGEQICMWGKDGDPDAASTYTVQKVSYNFEKDCIGADVTLFVTPGNGDD